jgi:hypothetical protein
MAEYTPSALSTFTSFFSSDNIEDTARRTGFVKGASHLTGQLVLALVTCGVWRDPQTTLAPWAAQVTPWDERVEGSPEALHQRMTQRALTLLQERLRQALATVQGLDKGCDDGLLPSCPTVSLADRTGFGLPDSLKELVPGSGGSAAKAGATMQAGWDYTSRVFRHCVLTPWNIPDQQYMDHVVACAHQGALVLFDGGYVKRKAFARIADAGASFCSRLQHQTTLLHPAAGWLQPLELAAWLSPVADPCLETPMFLGAQERGACRLVASRIPEPLGKERRRRANKKAQKQGSTPSKAPLALLEWPRFITHVPHTIGKMEAIFTAYPLRGPIARIFPSWKSSLP